MKKCIAFLLLFSTLFVLVGCGGGNGSPTDGDSNSGNATDVKDTGKVTEPESTVVTEGLVVPDDYTLNGQEFVILCTAYMKNPPTPFAANDTQLVLDEAIYRRNTIVEDKYNITFSVPTNYITSSSVDMIQRSRTAGDSAYDAAMMGVFDTSAMAYQGYLADMSDVPYIALEKSWWDQNATRDISIFGKVFYTTGDISYLDKEYTFAVIFNKKMAAEKQLGDLYSLVREGKWTIDELSAMCRTVSEDLNGDDVLDSNDKYGMILWDAMLTAMINASGNTIAHIEDDKLVLSVNNESTVAMVEKFIGLAQDKSVINFQHMTGGVGWGEMFTNGQSLFLLEYLKALPGFRDTDLDYGILPMPKLDVEQDKYYCGLAGYQTCMYCIPSDCYDLEASGIVSESLAYYSKDTVTPAYYERTLKGRNVQDEESVETLDIIFANRIYDLGLFYKVGDISTKLGQMLGSKSMEFASMCASTKTVAEKMVDRINGFFETFENE